MKNLLANSCGIRLVFFLSVAVAAIPNVFSQDQPLQTELNTYPLVTVRLTETRTFYSKILDQEMVLYIKIPATYKTDTQKIYPCWYNTDANLAFGMIADMANTFEVPVIVEPEIFVVGIGYKIRDMGDWGAWRTRDLTPTNMPSSDTYWAGVFSKFAGRQLEVKTGGATKFLECIEKEVFPFMESNYRVSSTGRGLGGYSYGGLFSLYVLLKRPELFTIYYAGSPSIRYDKGILYTYEKEYAATHNDLNATLFMTAGGAEDSVMIANVNKMAAQLVSRNFPGLKVETQVFPDETHMSCVPAAWMRAFRVLYKNKLP
jgi:predicted alpha/beta superfamily hydrolase